MSYKFTFTYSPLWRTFVGQKVFPVIFLTIMFPLGLYVMYKWITSKVEIEFKERGETS